MINFNSFNIESFQANVSQNAMFSTFTELNIKTFSAFLVRALSGLQALVHEQDTRRRVHTVLNFEFLVRERVLVLNPDNALKKCCNPLFTY